MPENRCKQLFLLLLCSAALWLGGCTELTPLDPKPNPAPATPAPVAPAEKKDVIVTYNYTPSGKVQLSSNHLVLAVGQRLILRPAPGLTANTRFTSAGENFFGNVMRQETETPESGRVIFTAIKPGKGKLQIIPNTSAQERSVEFWVTVQ